MSPEERRAPGPLWKASLHDVTARYLKEQREARLRAAQEPLEELLALPEPTMPSTGPLPALPTEGEAA